jgi:CHASE2 domain-containing sensor protein
MTAASITRLTTRVARAVFVPLSSAADRLGNRFYAGLAAVLGIVAVVMIAGGHTTGMQNKAYDLIMKYRLRAPQADPAIVILDIDEPSLAALAAEYGRWPWPRSVTGELIEGLAAQKPAAIVFDIAYSDPDVFNPQSDQFFREVVARHDNLYFPIIRLDPQADRLSELKIAQIPGSQRGETAEEGATLAAVLPFIFDVVRAPRFGTNNLTADADGILRRYAVTRDEYGWRVPSLPAAVVAGLGGELPPDEDILLNWRGPPPSYARVSFHEVYADLLRQERQRPADEFAGKIVIVGSTAPALFDFKATSVARTHPGVEVLAAAIDNLKRGDRLREVPVAVSILVTLVALAGLAVAFVYQVDTRLVNLGFTIVQASLLAVSYLLLNVSTWFVDLTAPFAFNLAFFMIARLNGTLLNYRRSGHPFFSTALEPGSRCRVIFMQCEPHVRVRNRRLRMNGEIRRLIGRSRHGVVAPPLFKELPLLRALFKDRVLFYWLVPESAAPEALADVLGSLERVAARLQRAQRGYLRQDARLVTFRLETASFEVDANDAWHEQGTQGLARVFALGKQGEAPVQIVASDEFKALCRSHPAIEVPPALIEAGLRCEERRRSSRKKAGAS